MTQGLCHGLKELSVLQIEYPAKRAKWRKRFDTVRHCVQRKRTKQGILLCAFSSGTKGKRNLGSGFGEPRFCKQRKFKLGANSPNLKTDVGAEGHAQVVVCAVGKANFIADVSAQAEETYVSFYTATRIEHATDTASTQTSRTVKESA